MSIDYVEFNNRTYAIVYMVINGRLVVIDVGIPRQSCDSDWYLIPASPEEAREVLRTWLSRLPKLKDGVKPLPNPRV